MYDQRMRDICSAKDKKPRKLKVEQIFVTKKGKTKSKCGKKGKACKCK